MSPRIKRTVLAQLAAIVAVGLWSGACQRVPPAVSPAYAHAPIPLIVRNHHLLDVTVYALRSDAWLRLGTVTSCGDDTLQLPHSASVVGAVRLALDPIGSRERYPLGPIIVLAGDRIELTIEAYLPASSWRVLSRAVADVEQNGHALHALTASGATPVNVVSPGPQASMCHGNSMCNQAPAMRAQHGPGHCTHIQRDSTKSAGPGGCAGMCAAAAGQAGHCPMRARAGMSENRPSCRL